MQSRWQPLDGIMYRGFPVYVNTIDGAMVYEQDYERLVSVPEEAEEAIVDILMQDFEQRSMIEAGMLTVRGRAN